MLLAFDVGNTNITLGLYQEDTLRHGWRMQTVHARTHDEYALLVHQLLTQHDIKAKEIDGVILASVVPALTPTLEGACRRLFNQSPLIVGPGLKTGIPILYDPPRDVGADRIVNAVAAYHRYQSACIVVDFGTATNFDSVTAKGEYAGGAIAPGINISLNALFHAAAKLPKVDLSRPPRVVGRNTVESIQSGVYYGYVSLVDGIVARMKAEMGGEGIRVIGTGGLAPIIAQDSQSIEQVDENITLEGLRLLYAMNQ